MAENDTAGKPAEPEPVENGRQDLADDGKTSRQVRELFHTGHIARRLVGSRESL